MQHDPRDAHPNQILDAIARNTERTPAYGIERMRVTARLDDGSPVL